MSSCFGHLISMICFLIIQTGTGSSSRRWQVTNSLQVSSWRKQVHISDLPLSQDLICNQERFLFFESRCLEFPIMSKETKNNHGEWKLRLLPCGREMNGFLSTDRVLRTTINVFTVNSHMNSQREALGQRRTRFREGREPQVWIPALLLPSGVALGKPCNLSGPSLPYL